MKNEKPTVVSIILTWNSADFISEALESLQRSSYPTKILVIDNHSADNTREIIRKKFPNIELHDTGANLGYAGGNNYGIGIAKSDDPDYIFILNPDAQVSSDCIGKLVKRMEQEKEIALISPIIYYHGTNKIWFGGSYIRWYSGETIQINMGQLDAGHIMKRRYTERVNGCAMLIRTEATKKVGLMDERYFLYYEESDWSVRFAEKGYKNGLEPTAQVWHKTSSSTGGSTSPLYQYYMSRNRLLFIWKHRAHMLPIVILFSIYLSFVGIMSTFRHTDLHQTLVCIKAIFKAYSDFALRKFGKQRIPN
jgi:hypothetical protein